MPGAYETVIGVEIHVELGTNTKLFCGCEIDFGGEVNTHTCPVCLGMPGILPVLNETAVEYGIKAALAMNCRINSHSSFERKNYFYPDLPKGYQISMYREPLSEYGYVDINVDGKTKRIGITRIHLEDDAAKSVHTGNIDESLNSYIDFNRAGVPLIEIVSDPDMRSAEEMKAYCETVKSILEYTEVSDCDMEKGQMRIEANISVRSKDNPEITTDRSEIKNLNSVRYAMRAVEYEVKRHTKALESGKILPMETRLFDVDKGVTRTMRGKEEAHDYRYFPEPDLVPVEPDEEWVQEIKLNLPELPYDRINRFMEEYGLPEQDAVLLVSDKELADYYEECAKASNNPKSASNWILTELLALLSDAKQTLLECKITPDHFAGMIKLMDDGTISGKIGKTVYAEMFNTGKMADVIVKEKGLLQITDENELGNIIDQVIADNPSPVEDYRGGNQRVIGFFVGQVMKATKGKANPQLVNKILREKL
ncbi:Asp-tRNA(Asn)/Glu-tRNA(Gln) amidotransferase subunit GatB [Candidatus Poribacteria bacterium]|nr:Asp-tRNA(Asn)/Glu-tRNA(Gln) amidotransferase subunit GatB [Candidatus Poribacteria bacterium]